MPIKRKSFSAIHWGSDAGSWMIVWSWPQPTLSNIPDFDNLQMQWSQGGTSHAKTLTFTGVLVSWVSDAQLLRVLQQLGLQENLSLYHDSVLISQQGHTQSHAGASWSLQPPLASLGWPSEKRTQWEQKVEVDLRLGEFHKAFSKVTADKTTAWEPTVNLNTEFLIQFIRMQVQSE